MLHGCGGSRRSLDHGVDDLNMQNADASRSAGLVEEDENLRFRMNYASEILKNFRTYAGGAADLSTRRYPGDGHIAIMVKGKPLFGR